MYHSTKSPVLITMFYQLERWIWISSGCHFKFYRIN